MVHWRALIPVAVLVSSALASLGDQSEVFQQCVLRCEARHCPSQPLQLSLWITRWTCTDECEYACMHQITDRDVSGGVAVLQYRGKWPFWRFLGMQEPASVAFSFFNLAAHIQGARKILESVPETHPMKNFYFTSAFISAMSWIWSAALHTRDWPITEKMDYFCAAMSIMYALYCAVIRFFKLYPRAPRNRLTTPFHASRPRLALHLWSLTCFLVYLGHVCYLSFLPRFDYTYNIIFNVVLGTLHNLLWITYSFPSRLSPLSRFPLRPKSYRPKYANKAAGLVALTTLAMCLELFDFPPWHRVLDAHALWHLATVPIAVLWYDFIVQDALDDGWREHKA